MKKYFIYATNLYRTYLVRFLFFRLLKEIILYTFRYGRRCYISLKNPNSNVRFELASLSSLPDTLLTKKIVIRYSELLRIPAPSFVGYNAGEAAKENGDIDILSPSLEIFELSNAMVVGGVDFIFGDTIAVHHDLFSSSIHQCPAENIGVISIDRVHACLDLYLMKPPGQLSTGISLIGQCAANYAHWLTETLPKLAIMDTIEAYADYPLLVDDNLHPNIYESIDLINKNHRKIIKVGRWSAFQVGQLIAVSNPGYERYIPHDLHSNNIAPYINRFSRDAFIILRESLKGAISNIALSAQKSFYLLRDHTSKNIRQIENHNELDKLISRNSLTLISTSNASFIEQVIACTQAKIIISPIGAPLANIIFCPPGSRIIVLAPYYDGATYYYYSNLAGILGHKIYYVLGRQTSTKLHPNHRNYIADLVALDSVLKKIKSELANNTLG